MTTNEPDPPPLPPKWSDPGYLTREAAEQRTHHILAAVARFDRDLASIGLGIDGFAGTINGQFEGGTFEISARAEGAPTYEPPTDLRDAIGRAAGLAIAQCHDDGPLTWHPCGQCQGTPCTCSGEPFSAVVADAVLPAVQAHVAAEVERARGAAERALALIAGTSCENSTSGPGACWRDYRDPNVKYGAERWCDPCIALAALTPDAADKLWQEHPGIDQHDEVAAGGERRRVEETAREWARIPDQVQGVGNLWEMARKAGSPATLLDEFHRRPGCDVPQPAEPSIDVPGVLNRLKYIEDEVAELREAVEAGDLPGALKEIADVVYTLYGMAWRCRLPLDEAVREVHRSNMTKTASPDDGKAIKGPGYSPADMAAVLAAAGEQRG